VRSDVNAKHSSTHATGPAARVSRAGSAGRSPFTRAPARPAFTLVELLVVLGIIVVLVALLLPSLVAARKVSQSLNCLAKLRRIGEGGVVHAAAHQGFYPLAGHLRVPDARPGTLNDPEEARYVYYRPPGWGTHVASFQAGIADTLGLRGGLEAYTFEDQVAAEDLPDGYLRLFYCPAHISDAKEATYAFVLYAGGGSGPEFWHLLRQSYVVNEAFLGWNDALGRRRGDMATVNRVGEVFLAADGLPAPRPGAAGPYPHATVVNKIRPSAAAGPITLADALAGNTRAGDPGNFDHRRHNGRINVAFLDGHVENLPLQPGPLSRVLLLP
jgi:prepilin-type processing-associated H-X9-DG protein/prepilin-type N-terminal cleavage/methylation domain-containing protein